MELKKKRIGTRKRKVPESLQDYADYTKKMDLTEKKRYKIRKTSEV